tara:strand:+ start:190 stop:483 length:294 start_codon:yes stop_codon:yes gene_type:complete
MLSMFTTPITPFVPSRTLAPLITYSRDVRGLAVRFEAENHAFLCRGAMALRLITVPLDGFAPGRLPAPPDQGYGHGEPPITDENSKIVYFGEAVHPA